MKKKIVKWLIGKWLPGHHLAKNPNRTPKAKVAGATVKAGRWVA